MARKKLVRVKQPDLPQSQQEPDSESPPDENETPTAEKAKYKRAPQPRIKNNPEFLRKIVTLRESRGHSIRDAVWFVSQKSPGLFDGPGWKRMELLAQRPRTEQIAAIIKAYGCNPLWLLDSAECDLGGAAATNNDAADYAKLMAIVQDMGGPGEAYRRLLNSPVQIKTRIETPGAGSGRKPGEEQKGNG